MKRLNPLNNLRIGAKLAVGFGSVIVIAGFLGFLGWNRLGRVDGLVNVVENANHAVENLLDARRQEKNFALRGFEKFGTDTQNSAEKWESSCRKVKEQLETLARLRELTSDERTLLEDATLATTGYETAFGEMTASRSVQDSALEGWKKTGWEVTSNIERAATDVIGPRRESAEQAKDVEQITHWARVGRELDGRVVKPYLLLRTTALYYILKKQDKEWNAYCEQLEKTKSGAVAWAESVKDQAELEAPAQAIIAQLAGYEEAGKQYREGVLRALAADTQMVEQARIVGDNANKLGDSARQRMVATMSNATMLMMVLAGVGIVLGLGGAIHITSMIVRPIRACGRSIAALANQDFSQKCRVTSRDELGQMAAAINQSIDATKKAFDDVQENAQRQRELEIEKAEAERQRVEEQRQRQADEAARERARLDEEHRRQEEQAAKERALAEEERAKAVALRRKVDHLLQVVRAASQGDLTVPVQVEGSEAVDELAAGIQTMLRDLAGVIREVTESAAQFAEGSRVIAESAQTLAQGAQTQSSSVEEMTAAIEELARSIEGVKDNALEADQVAKRTNQLALQGRQAVQKSNEAMEQIHTSSTEIGEIIKVISEIASQTNLLALNAAIEAARAGEHGMGFAVVADEVRKLAERSNQAAREISTLIKESTRRVQEGSQLSSETGKALNDILDGVAETVNKITEIATTAVQQSSNAEEVSQAIQGVAAVTEQSAAGSEQMASSSEQLGAQASVLRELVGRFKSN